jgi:hypothetical protein
MCTTVLVLAGVVLYLSNWHQQVHPVATVVSSKAWPEWVTTPGKAGGNWTMVKPVYAREFDDLYLNPHLNVLNLTMEQIGILQDCFNRLSQDRLAYEAMIATVENVDGMVYIDIPPYPQAGKIMEGGFYAALRLRLGDELADAIKAQLGLEIASTNSYMGAETQRLLVEVNPDNPGLLKVTRDFRLTPDGASRWGVTNGAGADWLAPYEVGSFGALAQYFPHP